LTFFPDGQIVTSDSPKGDSMRNRFGILSGVAAVAAVASLLLFGYGVSLLTQSGSSEDARVIVAIPLLAYGLFGMLISGAVQVLIAIYEKIAEAPK
jgi:hypothetical protein